MAKYMHYVMVAFMAVNMVVMPLASTQEPLDAGVGTPESGEIDSSVETVGESTTDQGAGITTAEEPVVENPDPPPADTNEPAAPPEEPPAPAPVPGSDQPSDSEQPPADINEPELPAEEPADTGQEADVDQPSESGQPPADTVEPEPPAEDPADTGQEADLEQPSEPESQSDGIESGSGGVEDDGETSKELEPAAEGLRVSDDEADSTTAGNEEGPVILQEPGSGSVIVTLVDQFGDPVTGACAQLYKADYSNEQCADDTNVIEFLDLELGGNPFALGPSSIPENVSWAGRTSGTADIFLTEENPVFDETYIYNRFGSVTITLQDQDGNAVSGAEFKLNASSFPAGDYFGVTNINGNLVYSFQGNHGTSHAYLPGPIGDT